MKRERISALFGVALFALSQGLHSEATLDFSADTAISEGELIPSLAWGIATSANRLVDQGPSLYFDLSADASKNLLDSEYSGSANLTLSAFRLIGQTSIGLKLEAEGVLPSSPSTGSAVASFSIPVTFNGSALSYSIAPTLSVDPLDSGYGSFGLANDISFMAGALVLKPGLDLSVIHAWSGGLVYALTPGLSVSWYPSFPLSVELSGGYRADSDEATADSWVFECIGVAAPSGKLFLTLTVDGNYSSTSADIAVRLESAFTLSRNESGREWSLPLQVGYCDADDRSSFSLGFGLRYAF